MRSWFWRIFISFWLAIMLIAALTFGLGQWMVEERLLLSFYPNLKNYAPQWTQLYEEQGLEAAQSFSKKMAEEQSIFAAVITADGVLSSTLTPQQNQHRLEKGRGPRHSEAKHKRPGPGPAARHGADPANANNSLREMHRINHEYTSSSSGNTYLFRFVLPVEEGLRSWHRMLLGPLALLATIIALSLVSWFLSRSITKPINRLREAVKDLGETSYQAEQLASISNRRDEIGILAHDFNRMGERLQNQLTSQRQLLRDVSHELRSPLARLRIALGLAERQAETEKIAPLTWAQLQRECDRLDQLIGEILSLA